MAAHSPPEQVVKTLHINRSLELDSLLVKSKRRLFHLLLLLLLLSGLYRYPFPVLGEPTNSLRGAQLTPSPASSISALSIAGRWTTFLIH